MMSLVCIGLHSKKNAVFFNPTLGQIWTNSNIGLKMSLKI